MLRQRAWILVGVVAPLLLSLFLVRGLNAQEPEIEELGQSDVPVEEVSRDQEVETGVRFYMFDRIIRFWFDIESLPETTPYVVSVQSLDWELASYFSIGYCHEQYEFWWLDLPNTYMTTSSERWCIEPSMARIEFPLDKEEMARFSTSVMISGTQAIAVDFLVVMQPSGWCDGEESWSLPEEAAIPLTDWCPTSPDTTAAYEDGEGERYASWSDVLERFPGGELTRLSAENVPTAVTTTSASASRNNNWLVLLPLVLLLLLLAFWFVRRRTW